MNRRDRIVSAAGLAAILVLSGCAVGPDYQPPQYSAPESWSALNPEGATVSDPQKLAQWWMLFGDLQLTQLINRAVSANPSAKSALARIREARAQRGISRASLYPSVDASGAASTTHSEADAGEDWRESYAVGLDASWEADLFGGNRRSIEAAQASLEAREVDYFNVVASLAAEVALNYVDLRTQETRLRITRASLKAQEEAFDLTRWRAEAGLVTQLDVEQARANLETTRSQIPSLENAATAARNQLSILIGEPPGGLDALMAEDAAIPAASSDVAIGAPTDIIRRRPDIRSAERSLAAQSARIGVATADLYPSLRLSGSFGLSAAEAGDLFNSSSLAESLAAGIVAPVFNAGAIRRNIEVQDAVYEQTLASYENTVLQAFLDVENALSGLSAARRRSERLDEAVSAATNVEQLARQQYQAGLIDFGQVLDAQRSLLSLQDQRAQATSVETTNMISLYKALGGGWPADGAALD